MTLARRAGTAVVLESGVYFPMLDLDRPRTKGPVCFHTHAGFRRIARKRHVTQVEIRKLFRSHRKVIERIANEVHATPSMPNAH